MSFILELLGKGLESPSLTDLVLPYCSPLNRAEEKLLEEFVDNDPAHTANKIRLGIHYFQSGSGDRAAQLFRELLVRDTKNVEVRLAWAAMHAAQGELDQALEQLQKAYVPDKADGRILFAMGYCYERQGNTEQALRFYHEGTVARPGLRRTRRRLAAVYLSKHDYKQTIEQCQALQKEHPEDMWNYLILGHLFLRSEEYTEAESNFERALTIEPDNFEMHDDQVESLVQSGMIDEAVTRMEEIIREQGEFPDSYVRLGDLHSRLGNEDTAINYYQQALEIHPSYLEAAVKLGTQYLRMKRYFEAAGKFNQAVEINDRLIGAYVGFGLAQKYLGKTQQARETFDLAVALEPNTNLLFTEMNRLQLKIAQSQKKEDWMSGGSVMFDPDEPVVTDVDKDILDIQMSRYRRKLREKSNHANLNYHYGLLLRGKGQIDQAIEHYQKALKINPSFFKAKIKLGLALWEKGDHQQAETYLMAAFEVEKEFIDLHYQLGLMYCDKMKFALAVEQFENGFGGTDGNADVHENLSLALQNMGLIDRATATWQAVCELEPQSSLAFQAQRAIPTIKQHMF